MRVKRKSNTPDKLKVEINRSMIPKKNEEDVSKAKNKEEPIIKWIDSPLCKFSRPFLHRGSLHRTPQPQQSSRLLLLCCMGQNRRESSRQFY